MPPMPALRAAHCGYFTAPTGSRPTLPRRRWSASFARSAVRPCSGHAAKVNLPTGFPLHWARSTRPLWHKSRNMFISIRLCTGFEPLLQGEGQGEGAFDLPRHRPQDHTPNIFQWRLRCICNTEVPACPHPNPLPEGTGLRRCTDLLLPLVPSPSGSQPLAAMAVTSTRIPATASSATPTAARTGHGLAKKRL